MTTFLSMTAGVTRDIKALPVQGQRGHDDFRRPDGDRLVGPVVDRLAGRGSDTAARVAVVSTVPASAPVGGNAQVAGATLFGRGIGRTVGAGARDALATAPPKRPFQPARPCPAGRRGPILKVSGNRLWR